MDFLTFILPKIWTLERLVDEECRKHIVMTINHLLKGSRWALQMLDSSTKFPAGLLEGNTIDLGNFYECITTHVEEDMGSFIGQHCLASGNIFPGKESVTWSMCIPSSCSAQDFSNLLSTIFNKTIYADPATCHFQKTRPFTSQDYLAISILSIFGILCILSTAYDIKVTNSGKKRDILRAFSWYTNGKRLLKVTNSSQDMIRCLHGLRFLSIVWIIVGHCYLMQGTLPASNMSTYRERIAGWDHLPLGISIFSVESFFLMSGLLVGYTFFKAMEKGRKFSFLCSCLVRFLRLTPILALSTLIQSGLIMHMGSGPLWEKKMEHHLRVCKKNWWSTLLYVQNYIHENEMCVTEAWYLAVDTQLYILSPLLLIPLLKRPRFGPTFLKAVILMSIASSFIQLYMNDLTFGFQAEWRHEFPEIFYTHNRATSWLIGLSFSYFLHKTRSWREDINQWNIPGLSEKSVLIGWLLGTMCLILPVLWGHRFSQTDFIPSSLEFSFYFSLTRPLWCLGLCWLIFACMAGYGGIVNDILSCEVFLPFSRLIYTIYLFYFSFSLVKNSTVKYAIYFTDYKQVHNISGMLLYVIIFAVPLHLTFEAPVTSLMTRTSEDDETTSSKPCKA